jgi:hypothetical protein
MRHGDAHPRAPAHARIQALAALGVAVLGVLVLIVVSVGVAVAAKPRHKAKLAPKRVSVAVSVNAGDPGARVPQQFLGLSYEVSDLARIAGYSSHGDLITLLRSLGPGILRFGGVSADTQVAWTDAQTPRPAWATRVLDAGDLRELASLAAQSGWHVLLTVNFGHFEPEAAAREAAAAKAALGEWLVGIELGNEPNAYALHGLRAEPWTFVQYNEQVQAYRVAIEQAAPGIPLAGPDTSGSSAYESWGADEAVNQRPALLTGHHYPLGCAEQPAPSIERLLSPTIRQRENGSLRRYELIAQQSEVPFRMDETNSVSCGGVAGISNTFASALWAVNYLAQAMATGLSGINFHGNPANCGGYAPLCAGTPEALAAGNLSAQPEWYAMLVARELVGDSPVATSLSVQSAPGAGRRAAMLGAAQPNVAVTTFVEPDGTLRFVVVDDDPPKSRGLALRLQLGSQFAGASILSLTGPSPSALSGVRLGGRAVAGDGTWTPPASLLRAANRDGVITVDLNPSNAALVTVAPVGG